MIEKDELSRPQQRGVQQGLETVGRGRPFGVVEAGIARDADGNGDLEAAEQRIDMSLNQTEQQRRMLAAYDPRAVLARGYAIIRDATRVGSEITIQQSKQTITAEVTHVAANE